MLPRFEPALALVVAHFPLRVPHSPKLRERAVAFFGLGSMARAAHEHELKFTLRTKVAMPTCTLHHDAGAPPCPCCETPHARTCAPWEGVEAHEYDCCCPLCREAWLLSDSESEEHFGVAMRSRCDEWEPNWSDEVLTRGATSQEILDEWRPECWFKDEEELARLVFADIDMDGSGTLDKLEIDTAARKLGVALTQREIDEGFTAMDTDGTAQSPTAPLSA